MNRIIYALIALSLVGCASSRKQETVAPAATPVVEEKAPAKTDKESSKKAAKASKPTSTTNAVAGDGKALQCANGSDKRSLEIKTTDRKGCELHYSKMDSTQTIATQVEGQEKCVEVQERIKGKLEASGFTCS